MNYFSISKTDKKTKIKKPMLLEDGYSFDKKVFITLYNKELIHYILNKKLATSLKKLVNLFLVYDKDEDGDEGDENMESLIPKIELLRSVLLEDYARFLEVSEVEDYLNKLEKLENKIGKKNSKKRRSL